jgi:hypothetical protein
MSRLFSFKKLLSNNPQIIFLSRSISFSEVFNKEQIEPMQLKRQADFKEKIADSRNKLKWRNNNTQTGDDW